MEMDLKFYNFYIIYNLIKNIKNILLIYNITLI